MKKFKLFFVLLTLTFFASCEGVLAQDSTATGGINIGSWHLSFVAILGILAGVEAILRFLPFGKNVTLLGLVAWIHKVIPSNGI